jgi:alpha-glucosidase
VPLLYTLLWRAHAHHEPILRPLFYDFPAAPEAYGAEDSFMVGSDLLVAPVLEPGVTRREVWLPDILGGWFDVRTGIQHWGGQCIETEAPLGAAPAFMRAGAILPLGPARSWEEGPLTLRLFPQSTGCASMTIYDDDGETRFDLRSPPCLIDVDACWSGDIARLRIRRSGVHTPRWSEIRLEDALGQPIEASVNAEASVSVLPVEAIGAGRS